MDSNAILIFNVHPKLVLITCVHNATIIQKDNTVIKQLVLQINSVYQELVCRDNAKVVKKVVLQICVMVYCVQKMLIVLLAHVIMEDVLLVHMIQWELFAMANFVIMTPIVQQERVKMIHVSNVPLVGLTVNYVAI